MSAHCIADQRGVADERHFTCPEILISTESLEIETEPEHLRAHDLQPDISGASLRLIQCGSSLIPEHGHHGSDGTKLLCSD